MAGLNEEDHEDGNHLTKIRKIVSAGNFQAGGVRTQGKCEKPLIFSVQFSRHFPLFFWFPVLVLDGRDPSGVLWSMTRRMVARVTGRMVLARILGA